MFRKALILFSFLILSVILSSCAVPQESEYAPSAGNSASKMTIDSEIHDNTSSALSVEQKNTLRARYNGEIAPLVLEEQTLSATPTEEFLGRPLEKGENVLDALKEHYNQEFQSRPTAEEVIKAVSISMTPAELKESTIIPDHWIYDYHFEKDHVAPECDISNVKRLYTKSARDFSLITDVNSLLYFTSDGLTVRVQLSSAGTGTEADPFRTVISEIWCDGELIAACNTVAEEMELGILPTFLAVELHGTDYLISEGLLTEAEAVLYAEEQAVYQASQAELDVETQPIPEIQVSDSEAVQ